MKKDKRIIISVLLLGIVLTINFISVITERLDYEKRKESGNERWKQVEVIIKSIDERVKELEENARCN